MLDEKRAAQQMQGPVLVLPIADREAADALLDFTREQETIMGRGEQREMLAFMQGVRYGRATSGA